MAQCVTLGGKDFVILERKEYERLMEEVKSDLPPLPEPDARGLTPAVEYGRILFARKIIRRREAVRLTQAAMARLARIRPETLNRIERGKVNPDDATMKKILRALEKAEAEKGTRRSRASATR